MRHRILRWAAEVAQWLARGRRGGTL